MARAIPHPDKDSASRREMLDALCDEFADLAGPDIVDGLKETDGVEFSRKGVILDSANRPFGTSVGVLAGNFYGSTRDIHANVLSGPSQSDEFRKQAGRSAAQIKDAPARSGTSVNTGHEVWRSHPGSHHCRVAKLPVPNPTFDKGRS